MGMIRQPKNSPFGRFTEDGRPIHTFGPTSTGLDHDADFAAILVVICKPCGGQIAWVFDTPDPRGLEGPGIMVQRSFPDAPEGHVAFQRPGRVNTAGVLDAYRFLSASSTHRTYCGVCRKFRTIRRVAAEGKIRDGATILRVRD